MCARATVDGTRHLLRLGLKTAFAQLVMVRERAS
jgi:hypothetical protein